VAWLKCIVYFKENNMADNMNAPGPWNNFNPSSVFDSTVQINPAGTTSDDGLMTIPTNYLYPDEKLGLDGIPYKPNAGVTNPAAYSYEPNQNISTSSAAPTSSVLNSQDLSQRTPSGSLYAPDLSAYNNSSLFNYTGPGGTNEYTYGQGLPTQGAGYNIWGSPSNVANPYFSGQFATTASTGPADSAINMPAIEMPAGVPAIGGGSGTTTTNPLDQGKYIGNPNHGGGTGPNGKDLTYQETLDYFGLNPYKQSTTFPSPEGSNPSLFDRQLAEMSPEQIARMNQILADENRMQQGQLGNVPESNYGMTWNDGIGYDGALDNKILKDKVGGFNQNQPTDIDARRNYLFNKDLDLGRPGDASYEEFVANPDLFTTATQTPDRTYGNVNADNTVSDYADFKSIAENQRLEDYKNDSRNRDMFRNSVLYPRTTIEGSPAYGGLDGFPGEYGLHNQEPYNKAAFDFAGKPEERSIWKGDEIDIQTPFRPEGVEGEDFYEGNDGNFYATHDDLGLEPLSPIENKPLYQIPERTYGDVNANTVASDYADFAGTGVQTDGVNPNPLYQIPDRTYGDVNANNVASDYAGFEGTRNMPSVYDLPADSYEREVYLGEIPAESTSNILTEQEFNTAKQGFLNIIKEGFESINAKYKGSTTDESAEAELGEIIDVIVTSNGGLPADSYAVQDEGTNTGESLFQNVAEDIPLSVFNPMDRVVMQAEAQAAQVAKAQAAAQEQAAAQAQAAAEAEARRNPPRPTPVPTYNQPQKNVISKPSPKPGGRAGAGATSQAYKTFARNYGGRYGL
jgi:hypothetical protein